MWRLPMHIQEDGWLGGWTVEAMDIPLHGSSGRKWACTPLLAIIVCIQMIVHG
jgi:hypothetical protein